MSIAGGYYKALEAAVALKMDTCQIFTKNNNQWRAKAITAEDVKRFDTARRESDLKHLIAHSSYLLNLASPHDALWRQSIDALVVELQRAEQLGLGYVVLHPGAHMGAEEEAGIRRVCQALDEALAQTRELECGCLLETTAGQGTALGWRFEHLAEMLGGVQQPERLGVCFDTCHVFAAGYPLGTLKEYRRTLLQFDKVVGLAQLRAFHLNDSKRPLGARVDRHAHIGHGEMGLKPFRYLLNDSRFRGLPMYLETPKGRVNQEDWDAVNLCTLRSLIDD